MRQELGPGVHIFALGTNAVASSAMLKAANEGASGENAVVLMPAGLTVL